MEMTDSPVVALNRAVVVMKVHGAEASLAALTPLAENKALQKYHLLFATQGHVLTALGRHDEARAAFSTALECDCTLPEKRFLQRQLAMLSMQHRSS
jgi:RNA polymerase sigma-70 factor (ECF subfamily)